MLSARAASLSRSVQSRTATYAKAPYTPPQSGWGVVITRAGFEELAAERLRQAGIRTYLPRCRHVLIGHRRPGGCGEVVLRPMLPRYLFAWVDEGQWITPASGDRWRHWRTPWDNARAFVSDEALDVLRAVEREEGEEAAAHPRLFSVGDEVAADVWGMRIAGIVRELRGNDRIIVETLAGRRVELAEADAIGS